MMVMQTRNKWMGLCAAAVIIVTVMVVLPQAALAQPEEPVNATLEETGNGTGIYFHYIGDSRNAVIFKVNVSGTIYDAYCIDIYTSIDIDDNLTVNGSLAEGNQSVNWTAVSYILYTYDYSTADDKNLEAAAVQAAIWYFTSEPYGLFNASNTSQKYQFMTDPPTFPYDGHAAGYDGNVRNRSFDIINDTKDNASTFQFPTRIELNASEEYVLQGQTINITATVYNQNNATIYEGVTVKFAITEGNGTLDPDNGTTNASGQVQINFTGTDANATTVVAWVEGSYGTLLRGDLLYAEPKQNVSTITLIPRSIDDLIVLPIPEQSTIVLMSTGVLALVGYVTYNSSRRKKKEE